MKVIKFKAPAIISAMQRVDDFCAQVETELEAETHKLDNLEFTVRVADYDVSKVKQAARPYHFQVVSED